ncbi:MAG: phosphotransferase [Myxococcota bacterium]
MDDRITAHAAATLPRLTGGHLAKIIPLQGDASSRRYYRLRIRDGSVASLVLMELPGAGAAADEVTKTAATRLPFVDVQEFLERGGLPVPRIHHYDDAAGLLYLEDLGDTTLERVVAGAPAGRREPIYRNAVDLLVAFQRHGEAHKDGCIGHRRRFDFDLLRWELEHFREWLLVAERQAALTEAEQKTISEEFDEIARALEQAPTTFVHRDFQSRNLMVERGELHLIDFQDALIGPLPYDLVGLLRDSYVVLDDGEVDRLIAHYLARHPFPAGAAAFRALFDLQALHRKLKDSGRFVYIDRVKKNPGFLPHIPASLLYVRQALERLPSRTRLREILARHLPELR